MRLLDTTTTLVGTARSWAGKLRDLQSTRLDRPRLVSRVELIGEYQGSGFQEAPYIARRPDGRVVQLPRLLFLVAAHADGRRSVREIAHAVSDQFGRRVSPDNVLFLLREKLGPAGLVAGSHDARTHTPATPAGSPASAESPPAAVERADPLLALRLRAALVPARAVRAVSGVFRPLFHPAVIGATVAWLAAFDVWLFLHHGIGAGLHEVLLQPLFILAIFGTVVLATAWHEVGHAAACRYGGAMPGAAGVGLYLVWPAFYTDVTDAYRLDRAGRLRTDLGGVYFNALFILGCGAAYFATGFEPLLVAVALQHVQVLQQFVPFARFDGYYVLTDLAGVPDILSKVKPVLFSLLPGRGSDAGLGQLTRGVRAVVVGYVVALVAALCGVVALVALRAPEYVPTAWASFKLRSAQASLALDAQLWPEAALAGLQALMLLLPALGMSILALRLLRLALQPPARRLSAATRVRFGFGLRAASAFAAGAAVALAVASWDPAAELAPGQQQAARTAADGGKNAAKRRCRDRAGRGDGTAARCGRKRRTAGKSRRRRAARVEPASAASPAPTRTRAAGNRESTQPPSPGQPAPASAQTTQPTQTAPPSGGTTGGGETTSTDEDEITPVDDGDTTSTDEERDPDRTSAGPTDATGQPVGER